MRLSQVVEMSAGHPFRKKIEEMPGAGAVAIQMKDISFDGDIDWFGAIETDAAGKRFPDWLKPGDILFAIRGNHNYAVLVDERASEYRAVASPHFFILRRKTDSVLPGYLAWLLNQAPLQQYFKRESEGSLTKTIRRGVLENAPIAIPPLEKQKKIIQLAETIKQEQRLLKDLIDNNQATMDGIAADLLTGLK